MEEAKNKILKLVDEKIEKLQNEMIGLMFSPWLQTAVKDEIKEWRAFSRQILEDKTTNY